MSYYKPGNKVTRTAPAGGVVTGLAYKIGQLLVIALATAVAGDPFEGQAVGISDLPKNATQAFTEGQIVYWDDTAKEVTTTATGNLLIGCADKAATAAAVVGYVRLNGIAALDSA